MTNDNKKGKRKEGDCICEKFIESQKTHGINYVKIKSSDPRARRYIRNNDGIVRAMGTSMEHPERGYFFGSKSKDFDSIVLIGKRKSVPEWVIELPPSVIKEWNRFSVDKNGQVKFNILHKDEKWFLSLTNPSENLDISQFVSPFNSVGPAIEVKKTVDGLVTVSFTLNSSQTIQLATSLLTVIGYSFNINQL